MDLTEKIKNKNLKKNFNFDRFVKMIKLKMEDQLRICVLNSISQFNTFWNRYNSTSENKSNNFNNLNRMQCGVNPMIKVEINEEIKFKPSLDQIRDEIMACFESILVKTSSIYDICEKV